MGVEQICELQQEYNLNYTATVLNVVVGILVAHNSHNNLVLLKQRSKAVWTFSKKHSLWRRHMSLSLEGEH